MYAAANAYPHGWCGVNARWKIKDGVLTIYGTGDTYTFRIPEFAEYQDLYTKIEIQEGMEKVGGYICQNLTNVTEVSVPHSLQEIKTQTFSGCSNLTTIRYAGTASEWASHSFSPILSQSNEQQKHLYCAGVHPVHITADGNISSSIFYTVTSITDLTTSSGCASIGTSAFRSCGSLKTIDLADGLMTIGAYAFYKCANLEDFTLPSTVTTLGRQAFDGCSKLTHINIPAAVTTIEQGVFTNTGITRVDYAGTLAQYDNITQTGSRPFGSTPWDLYCAGSIVHMLTASTNSRFRYEYCKSIKNLTFALDVTEILAEQFAGCSGLESVVAHDGITSVALNAFGGCTGNFTFEATNIDLNRIFSIAAGTSPTINIYLPNAGVVNGQPTAQIVGNNHSLILVLSGGHTTNVKIVFKDAATANAYKTFAYWSNYTANITYEGA